MSINLRVTILNFLCAVAFIGCGSSTANVEVFVQYENQAVIDLLNSATTSVRVLYTNDNLQNNMAVQPDRAAPTCNPCPGQEGTPNFFWETAITSGFPYTTSGSVVLTSVPLNATGTQVAIEFVQDFGDDGQRVVAFGCWVDDPAQKLSAATLQASLGPDVPVPFTIREGRTCGDCNRTQFGNDFDPVSDCP